MNRFLGVCVAVSVLSLSLSVLAPSCKVVRRCWCVFLLEPLRNNRKRTFLFSLCVALARVILLVHSLSGSFNHCCSLNSSKI